MNNKQAREFINKLFSEVWGPIDPARVGEFYHDDIQAHIGNQTVGFNDIVNRAKASKQCFQRLENDIQDVLVEGDKITVRVKQTAIPKLDMEPTITHAMLVYQLRDDKVNEMWALFDRPFNYREQSY